MRKKGIALIVVLVLIVLFSAFILVVVLSATMAIRKAHYYTDKTIALQIAESGINQVLYKMNYEKYGSGTGHKYPFGDGILKTTDIDTSAFGPQSSCTVKIDPDGTGTDTTIVSEGKYKGRSAKIYVNIRGYAKLGEDLNYETAGISEAFNKHVIYATTVLGTSSSVEGNITTTSSKPSPFPWDEATWTETSNTSIPVLGDNWEPEDPETLEPTKPSPIWDKRFKDDDGNDGGTGTYTPASTAYETTLPAGVSYSGNGTTETYTIDGASISENWIFEKADTASTLKVIIKGTTTLSSGNTIKAGKDGMSSTEDADIELDFSGSNNPDIAGKLVAERDIKIENVGVATPNQIGTSGDVTLWAGETISIDYTTADGPTINGNIRGNDINLKCGGNKIIINGKVYGVNQIKFDNNTNTTDGITINGDVIGINGIIFNPNNVGKNTVYSLATKSDLTVPNNANFSLIIDSTNSERKAGIVIYQDTNATINLAINSYLNITVGDNQVGGIIVYFDNVTVSGTGKVSNIAILGDIDFTDSENNKFVLINHSEDGSITINADINGSIYSAYYKDTTPSITLNSGTLTGSIITNGTVNLNGGSVIYNSLPYKNSPGDIYKGFVGGRRTYLPVPGSWRVEW